jgi:hypothetical protein
VRSARFAFLAAGAVITAFVVLPRSARAQNAPEASRTDTNRADANHNVPDLRAGWHIAPESGAVREMRHRLTLVATRAIGYFMAADSIEASLQSEGLSLHSDIAVLRVRLEATLDEAEAAINRSDLDRAGKTIDVAQALLDRFAAKLGG